MTLASRRIRSTALLAIPHSGLAVLLAACSSAPAPAEVGTTSSAVHPGGGSGVHPHGDYDGDGLADYADHATDSGRFWVHLSKGRGNGFSGSNWVSATTSHGGPWVAMIGDFDGDGLTDYADHATDSGQFWIHRNLGTKSPGVGAGFDSANWNSGTTAHGSTWKTLIADFNGDWMDDYADVSTTDGHLWVHINKGANAGFDSSNWNGNGTYTYAGHGSDWEVFAGDFDGDGLADYADHNISGGGLWVHRNLGPGLGFASASDEQGTTYHGSDVANWETLIGDYDGDGRADYADHRISTGDLWVHVNLGSGFDSSNWNTGRSAAGSPWEILGFPHRRPTDIPSCSNQWWDGSYGWGFYIRSSLYNGYFNGNYGWDTDIYMSHTPIQLRHDSKLIVASPGGAITCCGYVPRFQDMVTGQLFQFVHLQNINFSSADEGRVFPAGFVVGTSGGDTSATNCSRAVCGDLFAHLCVQTEVFGNQGDGSTSHHTQDWVSEIGPISHDNVCK